jgi:pimeloyl-ACP methyl ester carboxylesterase
MTLALSFVVIVVLLSVAFVLAKISERDPGAGANGLLFPVPEDLYPFAHRFADLPRGERIHYVDEGPTNARHTIVFLHGNPTWSFLYRHIIKDLRSTFRCVAPDYPGFGLSSGSPAGRELAREYSKSIEAFLDQLRLGPLTLMVQDWGGPIGLGLAGRHPEWFDHLVLGNTWAWPAGSDRDKRRFSRLMGGPVGRFLGTHFNGIVHLFMRLGTAKKYSSRELEMYLRPFRRKGRRQPTVVFPHEIVSSSEYLTEVESGLTNIAGLPTLIVWGVADGVYPPRDRERFEKIFPNHTTVLLREAKHYIQEDAPEEICAAIRNFLR